MTEPGKPSTAGRFGELRWFEDESPLAATLRASPGVSRKIALNPGFSDSVDARMVTDKVGRQVGATWQIIALHRMDV